MNVSPTQCFINGRGASQQKHIVSCATICVYFPLHVFVCNQMCVSVCVCVCVHAYPCHARRVWLIKVRYSRVMRDRTGSDRENGVFLLLPSDQ